MASSPFVIDETLPQASNLVSQYPGQSQAFRDNVKSWLLSVSDTSGKLKSAAMPVPLILTPSAPADAVEVLRFNIERAWGVYQSGSVATTDLEFRAQTTGSKKLRVVNLDRTSGFQFSPNQQQILPINEAAGISIPSLTGVQGEAITGGTVSEARIANLSAAKVTSGVFLAARIPDMNAGKIVAGTFDVARIPNLPAAQVTSGQFLPGRIPDLDAGKITTGAFDSARLTGSYNDFVNITGSGTAEFGILRATGRILGSLSDDATQPSFGWNGKTGIGMWITGGDNIAFAKGSLTRLTIAASAITALNGAVFTGPGGGLTGLNADEINSGTLAAARLPATVGGTDWVLGRLATMAVGSIGSLAFLGRNANSTIAQGTTYAGSTLHWSSLVQSGGAADLQGSIDTSANPSGTWMALGRATGSDAFPTTLFVRIS